MAAYKLIYIVGVENPTYRTSTGNSNSIPRPKGVEVSHFNCVFSLSLGTFLSLFLATKEKEMYRHNKT